jgi:hypothetical protein
VGLNLRRWESLVSTYELYPIISPLHLDGFILIHIRIWRASGLHENSPKSLEHICKYSISMESILCERKIHEESKSTLKREEKKGSILTYDKD